MASEAIVFHLYATLLLPYISDLGASCSPKSSLCQSPPLFHCTLPIHLTSLKSHLSVNFVPSHYLTCSLSPAPSCVLHPFQLLGSLVLTVYCPPLKFAKGPRAKPLSPKTIELMFPRHNNPLHN